MVIQTLSFRGREKFGNSFCFLFYLIAISISFNLIFKKWKIRTVFLSSYANTSGSFGRTRNAVGASVSTAFSSSPKLSRVFV